MIGSRWFAVFAALAACARDPRPIVEPTPSERATVRAPVSSPVSATPADADSDRATATQVKPKPALAREKYPWLEDASCPTAVEPLEARFDPPEGYTRIALADGSFGAWLRGLPLTAKGTPVTTFRGAILRAADHPNIAAVVAMDIGDQDLQQCADSVIRLHAEWLWSSGNRAMSYRAASGTAMPYSRWAAGERVEGRGMGIEWVRGGRATTDHASFRKFLDMVFAYANTGSLSQQAKPIEEKDIRPGDFVVMPGSPGHTVLVLDMALRGDGSRALLLGQGYMPAQSFQVLRPSPEATWFIAPPGMTELDTPFWRPFPVSTLRRLDG